MAGQAVYLLARIRDHVARVDAGNVAAFDDLAVALRAALCDGKGNQVLQVLARSADRGVIDVGLSRPPITERGHFSLGSVPTSEAPDLETGARWVPFQRWPNEPLMRVLTSTGVNKVTWGSFISDYANKWGGAHLGTSVPDYMWMMDEFEVAGLSLSGFLLRSAAVQAWNAGQFLLSDTRHMWPKDRPSPTIEQQAALYIQPSGDLGGAPEDRRARGEIHHYYLGDGEADFLIYMDQKVAPEPMTIRVPGLSYRLILDAPGVNDGPTAERETVRARRLPTQEEPVVVDRIGTTRMTGRVLCFTQPYGLHSS